MRISQINLKDSLIGKIDKNFTLDIGKVYNMEIVSLDGNKAQLRYRGREIEGQFKMDGGNLPKAGAHIAVKIDNIENGKILVKWMNPSHEVFQPLESNDLKNLLMSQGFSGTQENIEVIKKLLAHQLPITRENMIKALQGIKGEQGIRIDTAIFLMERNLPFHPLLTGLISQYLKQKRLLGNYIGDFFEDHVKEILDPNQGVKKEGIKKKLKEYILSFSNGEKKTLEKNMMERFQGCIGGENYEEIRKILYSSGMGKGLKEIMQHILLEPMMNRSNERELPYLYYQIPIQWKEDYETLEFFILPDKKTKKFFSKKEFEGVLSIYTHELGQIKIHLRMEDKRLDFKIGLENKEMMDFVKNHVYLLKGSLEKLNYSISNILCFIDNKRSFEYIEGLMTLPERKIDILV